MPSERDLYCHAMESKLRRWSAEHERFRSRPRTRSPQGAPRLEHDLLLEELEQEFRVKLRRLRDAAEDQWEALRDEVEQAWAELSAALPRGRAETWH